MIIMKMIITTGVVEDIIIQPIVEKKKYGGVVVREVKMYLDAKLESMRARKMKMMTEMVNISIAAMSNKSNVYVANNMDIL